MGCSSSKSQTNAAMRMLEYEHMAASEDQGLKVIPTQLDNEEWRDGLIRHVTCIPPLIFITLEIFYKFKEIDETKQNKRKAFIVFSVLEAFSTYFMPALVRLTFKISNIYYYWTSEVLKTGLLKE